MELWLGILLTAYVVTKVVAKESGSGCERCERHVSNIVTHGGYINRKKVLSDRKVLKYSQKSRPPVIKTKELNIPFPINMQQDTLPAATTTVSLAPEPSKGDSLVKPEFEKMVIGPLMVLAEKVTCGNYIEVLRLAKQMNANKAGDALGYVGMHRSLVQEIGLLATFYKSFYPWGMLECMKGIPVLFVQSEAIKYLMLTFHFSREKAENWSGFIGGASQAFFVCPLQKLKVSYPKSNDF